MADDVLFALTIHTRTAPFGETRAQENNAVVQILQAAAQRIGSGLQPIPLKDNSGNHVAHYEYGAGMLNHPDSGSK
jgi:hypothetical protein